MSLNFVKIYQRFPLNQKVILKLSNYAATHLLVEFAAIFDNFDIKTTCKNSEETSCNIII
ncbi:hypothetical protein T4D_2542 [Trichinella pseudospiralis]|uniref:Uncharacterized protein n=1 Tax=Trichinella pseudospiralis TaxID=6337 RepID=A0A0V1G5T6_TRIPS|nr:hypothetical protein T4D_2542 [Trichinella pseudospiralis]